MTPSSKYDATMTDMSDFLTSIESLLSNHHLCQVLSLWLIIKGLFLKEDDIVGFAFLPGMMSQ